jgi:ATP-dependent helicase HrpB
LTLVKEAQATPLREAFLAHLAQEQLEWLNELAPASIAWLDGRKLKLLYAESARNNEGEINPPELQVKLQECFGLKEHPRICEGKQPVKLWLCAPMKTDLATLISRRSKPNLPKQKPALQSIQA